MAVGSVDARSVAGVDDVGRLGRSADVAVVARIVLGVGAQQVVGALGTVDGVARLALVRRRVVAAVRALACECGLVVEPADSE